MNKGPSFKWPEILVFLLQSTHDDLYDVLLELCYPVLYSAINKFYLEGYEKDDLVQEGRVILAKTVGEYDFEKNLAFLEYYQMMLMNHLHKLLRKQEAQRRRANKGAYSLEELTENIGLHIQGNSAVETNPENAVLINEAYAEYSNELSLLERLVYNEYMAGQSVEDIVKFSSYSEIQVKNALYRCKRKLNKKLQ